jgi:hypothetical protein
MRGLIAIVGIGMASAGLALVVYQAFLWLHHGTWTAIPFSDVWFALGGRVPEQYQAGRFQEILERLLVQPLSLILFLIGGCLTWLGTAGKIHGGTKL